MPAAHKGAISFGLVHIPVALHTATQDNDIHFNQLCKEEDRKSTRLNSSHSQQSRMPSSA